MSAVSAASLIPLALEAGEVHSQIMWIEALGIKAGVLADPLSIIMANDHTDKPIISNKISLADHSTTIIHKGINPP